ncbi:MAG: RNA polymerase sigma factor [Actinomycetota bacterium]
MTSQLDTRWQAKALYEAHAVPLVHFAATVVGSADAEDVVASVAARLLPTNKALQARDPVAYLYRAVLNAARSHLRSAGRRAERERRASLDRSNAHAHQYAPTASGPGPDLSFALDALTTRQRAVVHLVYWEQLTGAETADRLGISEGSVRTHLARAKQTMRELING